jgi:hypothetical protein
MSAWQSLCLAGQWVRRPMDPMGSTSFYYLLLTLSCRNLTFYCSTLIQGTTLWWKNPEESDKVGPKVAFLQPMSRFQLPWLRYGLSCLSWILYIFPTSHAQMGACHIQEVSNKNNIWKLLYRFRLRPSFLSGISIHQTRWPHQTDVEAKPNTTVTYCS